MEGCLARAEYMLHSLTQDRLQDGAWEQDETLAKCVRMAHCALADAQHAQGHGRAGGRKSDQRKRGKLSRSVQQDDAQTGSFERRCLRIAAQYIPIRSGLLYRGERMLTPNASCTLYLQTGPGAYTRGVCPRLLLAGRRGWREHRHPR